MYTWQSHLGTSTFDPRYHTNPRVEIMSFLAEPPGTLLDIGCGGGATGVLVKQKFPGTRVVGIEINPSAAAHALAAHHPEPRITNTPGSSPPSSSISENRSSSIHA